MPETLRVALIGFGVAGSVFHAPLIQAAAGLSLEAIVTSQPGRRKQAQGTYPQARIFNNAEQLWSASSDFDVAVVAAPNRYHVQLGLAALDHGLHVVVDKPVATSIGPARRLAERAQECQKMVSVFHNRRWDGDFLTIKSLLQEGTLGAVTRLESRFERWRPQPRPGAWRELEGQDQGGGLLLDLGSHLVDQAVQLFGRPHRIYAEIDRRRHGVQGDDDCFVALEFPRRVRVHLWASCMARVEGPRFLLRGTGGSYQKFALDPQEAALRAGRPPAGPDWGREDPKYWGILTTDMPQRLETQAGDYPAYYRELERSLREELAPPVPLEEALLVMEILGAAQESAESGQVVDFRST